MMLNAPDLGGKENSLAGNLTMFIIFLSFYEATNHRLDGNVFTPAGRPYTGVII